MIPDDQERLEAMLRGLPLRPPSVDLDDRLVRAWSRPARLRRRLAAGVAIAASLAMAASLLVLVVARRAGQPPLSPVPGASTELADTQPAPPAKGELGPQKVAGSSTGQVVVIEREWVIPQESRVVTAGDAPPVLHERCQVVRDVRQVDAREHTSVQWTISSDETAVVPLDIN
jgi:hypothetical protein